jgi:hypothetical protein
MKMKRVLILAPWVLSTIFTQVYADEPSEEIPRVVISGQKIRNLRISYPYDGVTRGEPSSSIIQNLTQNSQGIGDSVAIYKGKDPNGSKSCYVMVHYSDDPANPVHTVVVLASDRINFQTASVQGNRVKVHAARQDWEEVKRGGSAYGVNPNSIANGSISTLPFVHPKDLNADGTFSGTWQYRISGKTEISGKISKDLDTKRKRKILEMDRSYGDASTASTLEFSSETNRLLEASVVMSSQEINRYDDTNGNLVFSRKLSADEGRATNVQTCTDLSEPRKPARPSLDQPLWKQIVEAYENAESYFFTESPISKKARNLIEGRKGNTGENSCDTAPVWASNAGDCVNLQTAINKQPSKPMKDDAATNAETKDETKADSRSESGEDQSAASLR